MTYDVVIVGAGPAGLTAAIRLKQLGQQHDTNLRVCIIEKGAAVGSHILSGAVLEPRALSELFPHWQSLDAPVTRSVTKDHFLFLTQKRAFRLPTPPQMNNHGNFIISLEQFCKWLATQAENLGVEIYPGFAASEVLIDDQNRVYGIATGDVGVGKNGEHTSHFQPGMELHAKQVLLAEGCRGSLTRQLIEKFKLQENSEPQTYAIGIKELWEVDSPEYHPGKVVHSIGWPLDQQTYGGSFIYHLDNNRVAVGFVVGLDYQNPYLSPFDEMQRFKTHPAMKALFQNGKRICYGARALNEGGFQSIPKLTFQGGMLIGDCAGFLNVPKIKGTHTAMKSAMIAAETVFDAIIDERAIGTELVEYKTRLEHSWIWQELYQVRNIRPAFQHGLLPGLVYAGIETYLLRGKEPWTFKNHADNTTLKKADECEPIAYPKPDNQITFDRLSSVFLSNTYHEENQPCHLKLKDPAIAIDVNYKLYDSPETRYCPAAVYEIVYNESKDPYLQINSQNCVHCKTCDIKDPTQNIVWETPQGGEGPNYSEM